MSVSIGNVVKKVNIPCEAIVSVTLWDLPGREEMDLRRSYYKDVDAAVGLYKNFINYFHILWSFQLFTIETFRFDYKYNVQIWLWVRLLRDL